MIIKNMTWYTGAMGCIGVVEIDSVDEAGRRKNYIGVGDGLVEDIDANRIASMGVPFYVPPWLALDISKEASLKAVSMFYQEVCRRAEQKISQMGRLEGAHYASMVELMTEMGLMKG